MVLKLYRCKACGAIIEEDFCDWICDFDYTPLNDRPQNMVHLEKWETVDRTLSQELLFDIEVT